jgi:hypothetical protein
MLYGIQEKPLMYRNGPNQCMTAIKRSHSCIEKAQSMHDGPQKKPPMYRKRPNRCMTAVKGSRPCIERGPIDA